MQVARREERANRDKEGGNLRSGDSARAFGASLRSAMPSAGSGTREAGNHGSPDVEPGVRSHRAQGSIRGCDEARNRCFRAASRAAGIGSGIATVPTIPEPANQGIRRARKFWTGTLPAVWPVACVHAAYPAPPGPITTSAVETAPATPFNCDEPS